MVGVWSKHQGKGNLLIVALGWSCDQGMISHMDIDGYDIFAIYDYRDISTENLFSDIDFSRYQNIDLLAWSFGVWAADIIAKELPRVDFAIAVNGTRHPINDNYGIARRTFKATLWVVEKMGLEKFNQRMIGDYGDNFKPAERSTQEQIEELRALKVHAAKDIEKKVKWNMAIVALYDDIFPVENMITFWKGEEVEIIEQKIAHYPFTKETIELLANRLKTAWQVTKR